MLCPAEKAIADRFEEFFKDLDPVKTEELMTELIDHYTYAKYGMSILDEVRKVKKFESCVSIQPIAEKAILVSPFGFKIVSVTQHPKGGVQVIMKETTRDEHRRERNNRG